MFIVMIIITPCCVFWKGWRGAADKCKGRKTPFVGGDSLLLLTLVIIIIIICITILSMHIVVKWTMVPHTSHCICVPLCCYVLGAPVRLLASSGQWAVCRSAPLNHTFYVQENSTSFRQDGIGTVQLVQNIFGSYPTKASDIRLS